MNRVRARRSASFALAAVALAIGCEAEPVTFSGGLPAGLVDALNGAGELELVALDPLAGLRDELPAGAETLHGFAVVGRAPLN